MFLILLFALTVPAQTYEYGKPAELKGLKKIFIDTGTDLKRRGQIVKTIEKAKLPDIEILDSSQYAEIIIIFRGGTVTKPVRDKFYDYTVGEGLVAVAGSDGRKTRVLMSFESTQDGIGEKKPAEKFAKEFIKEYKKANDLK